VECYEGENRRRRVANPFDAAILDGSAAGRKSSHMTESPDQVNRLVTMGRGTRSRIAATIELGQVTAVEDDHMLESSSWGQEAGESGMSHLDTFIRWDSSNAAVRIEGESSCRLHMMT